jgi:hypothetical protein
MGMKFFFRKSSWKQHFPAYLRAGKLNERLYKTQNYLVTIVANKIDQLDFCGICKKIF